MKNAATTALIIVLLVVAVALGVVARRQTVALRMARQQIQDLSARLDLAAKSANLDLQQRCAEQAMKAWTTGGWEKEKNATYQNHYNQQLNKCFMRIENSIEDKSGATYASDRVVDAFEGKVWAELTWKLDDQVGNAMRCKATLPTGEEIMCTSPEEFDSLAGQYMN